MSPPSLSDNTRNFSTRRPPISKEAPKKSDHALKEGPKDVSTTASNMSDSSPASEQPKINDDTKFICAHINAIVAQFEAKMDTITGRITDCISHIETDIADKNEDINNRFEKMSTKLQGKIDSDVSKTIQSEVANKIKQQTNDKKETTRAA